jgi:hypothetical protein
MPWQKRDPIEPEQGPTLSETHLEQIVQAHQQLLDAEQDAIAERIHERMNERSPASQASPAT